MNIGFIGLGVMGRPMALHLLEAGYTLGVYARRQDAAAPLIAAGAFLSSTPAELASRSDVVITMVTATSDVEEVLLGENGVLAGARPGATVIDMSTIAPRPTQRIAAALGAKQVRMLDAPVTGGPAGAEAATLTIMVGGDPAVLEEMRPVLGRLGKQIVHMGGHGAGQIAKACNQLALLVNAQGAAEALALGVRCGLESAHAAPGALRWYRREPGARRVRRAHGGAGVRRRGWRRAFTTKISASCSTSLVKRASSCRRGIWFGSTLTR